jgi:hypothetical protein
MFSGDGILKNELKIEDKERVQCISNEKSDSFK